MSTYMGTTQARLTARNGAHSTNAGASRKAGATAASAHAPAAVTISEDYLHELHKTVDAPVFTRPPRTTPVRDPVAAKAKVEKMRAHDMEVLRLKTLNGDVEGEAVEALVKKLEPTIALSRTGQRILAEERKAHVVRTLEHQQSVARAREEAERQRAEEDHHRMIYGLAAAVQNDEEKAAARAAKALALKNSVSQQLEDRAFQRLVAIEAKEQEAALLQAAAQRAAEAEEAAAAARREAQKQKARETAESNRQQLEREAMRKQRDKDYDESIRLYQLDKAAREAELEEARAKERKEKALQQAKLLEEQLRAMSGAQADEEARARRHEEAKILADRARAKAEEDARAREREAIKHALAYQLDIKQRRKEEDRAREEEMKAWQLRSMSEAIVREAEAKEAKKQADYEAMRVLKDQKAERERLKQEEAKKPLEERRKQALVEAAERIVTERFRQTVHARMEQSAMPEHFLQSVRLIKQKKEGQ